MVSLDTIRDCLDGAIPSAVATCSADGTPNATFVSEVHYVDPSHVALSFQFFSKTRATVLTNPRAVALVNDPFTAARYRLELEYLRTEVEGPLFESMKAKLAGIASHSGMAGVFMLKGSDVYRVLNVTRDEEGRPLSLVHPRRNRLTALRACSERLASGFELGKLLDETLLCLETALGIHHSMALILDASTHRLYAVASRGYDPTGVGSEIAVGDGVIGVAAQHETPIRISHASTEYSYGRAIRESLAREGMGERLASSIPFPGLSDSRSQLAVPIKTSDRLYGVLFVESPEEMRFSYDDEDALVILATQLAGIVHGLELSEPHGPARPESRRTPAPSGVVALVEHYAEDDSVFVDKDYVIKGVAGAILYRLVSQYLDDGRIDFTNRELRLDATLRLPDIADNLEARLVLLERRLEERDAPLRIEKTGRGRFRLRVERPLALKEIGVSGVRR